MSETSPPPPDWEAIRQTYVAGATAAQAAALYGVSITRVRSRARAEGWRKRDRPAPGPPPSDPQALARDVLDQARQAAARGDLGAVERAARAAERLVKAGAALGEKTTAAAGPPAAGEEPAALIAAVEERLFELVETEVRRRLGEAPDALPLWQRFNRPDLRRPEDPLMGWTMDADERIAFGPAPDESEL